jgi:hypothetical protein
MDAAAWTASEVPEHPGVGRAEEELAALGPLAGAVDVLEDPGDLRRGEVGAERQSGGVAEAVETAVPGKAIDDGLRARVLPDDRVRDGTPGRGIPHHGRLALVRDADRADRMPRDVGAGERLPDDLAHVRPDLGGIVLDPARAGEDLAVLLLADAHDGTRVVEHDGT